MIYESYDVWNDFYSIYGNIWRAHTITPTVSHPIQVVELRVYRDVAAGTVGIVNVEIRATDGLGHATGPALASGSFNGDAISNDPVNGELKEVWLVSAFCPLIAGTKYAIVVSAPSADASNRIKWLCDNAGTYTGGNGETSNDGGVTWLALGVGNIDFCFKEGNVADWLKILKDSIGYQGATSLADKLTAARAALIDEVTALRMAELDAANLPTDIDAIKAQTDKLAGAAPGVGTVNANWNTAVGTSGEAGEDLVTIGANDTKNKLQSLMLDVSACTDGALLTVKMFSQINGTERKIYSQTFLVNTDPDGLWIVQGTVGIHEALRVEVYSNTNEAVNIAYDYMLEVM